MGDERFRRVGFGQEVSTWPMMKVAHARAAWATLQGRVIEWNSRAPLRTYSDISADGRVISVRLQVVERPPLQEWSLLLGDIVHNLRAALDALAWELSHLDGATPPNESQVYFPVSWTKSDFDAKVAALGSVAAVFGERMRQFQPFVLVPRATSEAEIPTLGILHALDLQDKHRGALSAGALVGQARMHFPIQTDDPQTEARFESAPRWAEIEDGAQLATVTFSHPVRLLEDVRLPVNISLHVDLVFREYNSQLPLDTLVENLVTQVMAVFETVMENTEDRTLLAEFPFEVQPPDPQA